MSKRNHSFVNDCIKNFNDNKGKPLKILLSFYKGEGLTLLKSTILLTFQNLPVWVLPIVTANIINIVTSPKGHSLSEILINAAIMAVIIFQNAFSTFGVSRFYDRLTRKIEYSLRSGIIQKLQQLSIGYHKNTNAGKLQSKIMRDCENIEALLASIYRNLYVIVVSGIIAISVTAYKSPVILLFFTFFIPVEVFFIRWLGKNVRKRNTIFRTEVEQTQSNVSEMLELIPVTRAHGLQKREVRKMDDKLENVMAAGYNLDKANSFFLAFSWVIMQLAQLCCLTFSGILAFKGKISVGEVVLYQTYFGQLVNYVNTLFNIYPQLTKGMESVNSIGEIFYDEQIETDNSIIPLPDMRGQVEFKDVCYAYKDSDTLTLKNFSLFVKEGESIAFVGASGAGKSTLLDLLIGFDRPCDGQILIDRVNMMNLDMEEYRSQIAVVPQNTILFSGSVRDNITYGLDNVTDEEVNNVLKCVGLDELVNSLPHGMHTILGEHGGKLSGGQRQRISIARALLRKPKLIIFDEATSALDSASEKKVQEAVDNMMKQCTTFMVAHRLSTIKNVDRIVVLDKGEIVEIGTHDELMAKQGAFYNLKKLQE